jgi:hypothetical protein
MTDINKDKDTTRFKPIKKRILFFIAIFFVFCLILISWQYSLISTTKEFYNQGKYYEAKEKSKQIINSNWLGGYKEKVNIMGSIDYYFVDANKYFNDSYMHDVSVDSYIKTIKTCIAYNDRAVESECLNELLLIRKEAAQTLANDNCDIIEILNKSLKKKDYLFYPMISENPDYINQLIKDINNNISESEKKKYQNDKNPVQITQKDSYRDGDYMYCTGTVSNVSDTTHYNVKVRVTYYSEDEEMLTSDWSYAVDSEGIRAGENQQFEIMTKVNGDAPKYKVEILEYQ